jgi:DNA-binding GntR family transcriptional regulator
MLESEGQRVTGIDAAVLLPAAVKPPTSSVFVAAQLRDAILRGSIAPGTRLRQTQLAREFGVSTTPVREAFQLLQSEGIVESDPHRGVVVRRPSAAEIAEDYEIRCELECLAAAKALPTLTDEDIAELEALEAEMEAVPTEDQYIELNHRFHDTLYRASGQKRLCALIASLRTSSSAYVYHRAYMSSLDQEEREKYVQRLWAEHQEILAACRARDRDRLVATIREHIENIAARIVESMA